MSSPKPLVLVTGLTGYCASSIALAFLDAGYSVRGTVRRQEQADAFKQKYSQYTTLEVVVVPDVAVSGAFDEVCKDVGVFIHAASPVIFGYTDAEKAVLEIPAIRGTQEALESIQKSGTVKQFILLSSVAAMSDYKKGPDGERAIWEHRYSVDDCKVLAERAAWSFVEEKKASFTLTIILPTHVLGATAQPIQSVNDLSLSVVWLARSLDKPFLLPVPISAMVDVNGVALAHLQVIERPETSAGKRYLLAGAAFSPFAIAAAAKGAFPDKASQFALSIEASILSKSKWDVSLAENNLRIEWTPLEETVQKAYEQIFALEGAARA